MIIKLVKEFFIMQSEKKEIADIDLAVDKTTIAKIIDLYAKENLSSPSYSFLSDVFKSESAEYSVDDIFFAFGKAMFNEIAIDLLLKYIKEQEQEQDNANDND